MDGRGPMQGSAEEEGKGTGRRGAEGGTEGLGQRSGVRGEGRRRRDREGGTWTEREGKERERRQSGRERVGDEREGAIPISCQIQESLQFDRWH